MSKYLFKFSRRTHAGAISNLLLTRLTPSLITNPNSPSSISISDFRSNFNCESSLASQFTRFYSSHSNLDRISPSVTLNPQFNHHEAITNLNSPSSLTIPDLRSTFHVRSSLAIQFTRFYSSASNSDLKNPSETAESDSKNPSEWKHQEIEGPTVERDISPLAEESREVSLRLMKTMYDVSRVLGALSLAQLALGAWMISHHASSSAVSPYAMAMSVTASAVPMAMALLMRRAVKEMRFFEKMERIGRLQILTSTMQISKQVNLFFVRLRGVCYLCLAGLPIPIIISLTSSSSAT